MATGTSSEVGATDRALTVRRISFAEPTAPLPKHFMAGDLVMSHVVAVLSAVFPEGEDYFVRSVRNYRDQVRDPALKAQVAGFIGQEAIHGREHRELNERFAELGYPTKRIEKMTAAGLRLRTRFAPPKANLAATAALEHFTATLAEMLLTNEEARDLFGHEEVRNLFLWHALEESEHKAVAFDVYKAVGGTERMRTWTMNAITVGFLVGMAAQTGVAVLMDPEGRKPRVLLQSLRRLRRSPLLSKELWRQLREYNRPDFHPDDRETAAIIAEWRERLFGEQGTLNDKLAGAAA